MRRSAPPSSSCPTPSPLTPLPSPSLPPSPHTEYALLSQTRYTSSLSLPHNTAHIISVPTPTRKDPSLHLQKDEHPRSTTTLESLARLPSAFKKGGVVTAGNASGIADGAAANVVASEKVVREFGLEPLARVVGWGVTACAPEIMGIGPV